MALRIIDDEILRIRIILVGVIVLMGIIVGCLWNLQIVRGSQFESNIARQSIRRVRLPELRGRIFDRHQECLADNRPSHNIAVYVEELRQSGPRSRTVTRILSLMGELQKALGTPPLVDEKDVDAHFIKQLPLPLIAYRDLGAPMIARWAEQASQLPGVDIYTEAVRKYPYHELACHILGYVGRGGMAGPEEESYDFYLPQMEGKAGLEKVLDPNLRGEAGGQNLRVDVSGYRYGVLGTRKPVNGDDIILTLDRRIQAAAESVLDKRRGAVCVVDPWNGDVLALASYPGFDVNDFVPTLPASIWEGLLKDKRKPLLNRAVFEQYAPGSIFKPVVALAALESGKSNPDTTFYCPGYFEIGSSKRYCGYRSGHGSLNLRQAIEQSCNVYFWRLSLQVGYDPIYHMAGAMGLGQKTGIPLDAEAPGILPDNAWKREHHGDSWRDGDTCNVAIGQGYIATTPLQMAMVTATIANGGYLYKPRLIAAIRKAGAGRVMETDPEIVNTLNWSPRNLRVVREGMRDVVMGDKGTGRLARVDGLDFAGKTGTAQFGPRGHKRYRTWMIAYAPSDYPRYALALVLEDEEQSSGLTAAPAVQKLLQALFKTGEDA